MLGYYFSTNNEREQPRQEPHKRRGDSGACHAPSRIGFGEVVPMAVISLYRDVINALGTYTPGEPTWPRFAAMVYNRYPAYFDGLIETYGPELFSTEGLPYMVERLAPALSKQLSLVCNLSMEERAEGLLKSAAAALPTDLPPLYLGTLFFMAPAATFSIEGAPGMALGLERFHPNPPDGGQKYWYHPDEMVEMVPHEAVHVARMKLLRLPPTPRGLTLLDMVMLEGTALTFTDGLLGRETLATFLAPERLAWHRANDALVRSVAVSQFKEAGMGVFQRFFGMDSPVSGYYVGWSLCREYLDRYGAGSVAELIPMPSHEILRRLGAS